MKNRIKMGLVMMAAVVLLNQEAGANGIAVTNEAFWNANIAGKYMFVSFDVSWSNSWNDTGNHDAAWVFVKFKAPGSNDWQHATLSATNSEHTPLPAGSAVESVPDGKGVFIYRSDTATGGVSFAKMRLRWNYGADGYTFAQGDQIAISVQAIEMVYCPTGAFYLGSTGTGVDTGHFYDPTVAAQTTNAFLVTSENAITVGTSAGNLYYANVGGNVGDGAGIISNAFPKGYNAFYCMKYEISQGQYASFLNMLTGTQWTNRFPNQNGVNRHTISGTCTNVTASVPDRACNFLNWADGAAYADWSGLRPMTELEFEKACRGPALPVRNEYAWGTATIIADGGDRTINVTGPENGAETNKTSTALGAAVYNNRQIGVDGVNVGLGPVRCGLFATSNSTRITSGATYWGIMEMSGNLWERPVTVGNTTGRTFTGLHGNGVLTAAGDADVTAWPGTGAVGAGFRGGSWSDSSAYLCVSDRIYAASTYATRNNVNGWRAVRVAP